MPQTEQRDGFLGFPGSILGPTLMLYDNDAGTFQIASCNKGVKMLVQEVPGIVGGAISTDPDVAVGVGVTTSLSFPPAGSARTMTIQVTGAPGALVRVREVGGAAGSGILLGYLDVATYEAAIAQLEIENVGAVAATVAAQYEKES